MNETPQPMVDIGVKEYFDGVKHLKILKKIKYLYFSELECDGFYDLAKLNESDIFTMYISGIL